MTATQLPPMPSSTVLPSAPHGATSPQHSNRLPIPPIPAYEVSLSSRVMTLSGRFCASTCKQSHAICFV